MIFARDKSQMCNNLLQYAHVYAWGREHGRKVISMRFSYKYQYFKICHTSLTSFPLYLFAKYAAALGILPTANCKHDDLDDDKIEQKLLRNKNVIVSGWFFRRYDLFLKYRDEICDLFTIDSQITSCVQFKDNGSKIRLGVHIRRGDYANWKGGIYCYPDSVYIAFINKFKELFADKEIVIYIASNDPNISLDEYRDKCNTKDIYIMGKSAPEDLFILSKCNYLIGAPSTFSLVASMYDDIPLYRMDNGNADEMAIEGFKKFDYWFRRII